MGRFALVWSPKNIIRGLTSHTANEYSFAGLSSMQVSTIFLTRWIALVSFLRMFHNTPDAGIKQYRAISFVRKVQKQTKSSAGPGGSSYHDNNHNNINNSSSSSSSSSGSISFNLYFVLLRSTYFVLYNSRCSRNTTACYNSTTLRAILQNTTTYYCNVSTNQSILQITFLRTTTVRLGTTRAVILRTTTLWLCTAITCYMLRATRTQNVQYNARSNLWDAKNTVTTTFMLQ